MNDEERFWARVVKDGPVNAHNPLLGPCWLWSGGRDMNGYGRFHVSGTSYLSAHRYAYLKFVGEIPFGLHIDHLCRVTSCVRPEHLEAVTPTENIRRGRATSRTVRDREAEERKRMYWGQNIADIRHRLGLSQHEFAERLGTRQTSVSQWERGHFGPRTISILRIIRIDPLQRDGSELFPDSDKLPIDLLVDHE